MVGPAMLTCKSRLGSPARSIGKHFVFPIWNRPEHLHRHVTLASIISLDPFASHSLPRNFEKKAELSNASDSI